MNPTNEREIGPAVARNLRLFDAELRGHTTDIAALDTSIDALDTRIDALETVPWILMGLGGTGWSNYGFGWAEAAYRKIGDQVQIRGLIAGGAMGSVIANMPVGYRPVANQILTGQVEYGSGYFAARIDILSSGVFQAYWNGGTANYLSINVTYSTA